MHGREKPSEVLFGCGSATTHRVHSRLTSSACGTRPLQPHYDENMYLSFILTEALPRSSRYSENARKGSAGRRINASIQHGKSKASSVFRRDAPRTGRRPALSSLPRVRTTKNERARGLSFLQITRTRRTAGGCPGELLAAQLATHPVTQLAQRRALLPPHQGPRRYMSKIGFLTLLMKTSLRSPPKGGGLTAAFQRTGLRMYRRSSDRR